ncbi:hypothetical protein VOLCADRAFT_95869 [Volvox carteri f. nagariensis]|uniref:Uncharacterized protein n=1 Tax=Volvox carteri f. nagariensis TaxID=3068 RepID=D8U8L2_VOLCA|nr:uncharacterized protein VOLCADRAFT_95869 [Volvox carteri f. nagariensis]EFJ43940.1 hypothetical protein VOLCADRAFT_95869 [Volvox carteri f. nagariensis]|eukprot:XP_002954952.1 hypothetical protein VOLCADRAFT_95869 [Volvox carteri f. nagariensis]
MTLLNWLSIRYFYRNTEDLLGQYLKENIEHDNWSRVADGVGDAGPADCSCDDVNSDGATISRSSSSLGNSYDGSGYTSPRSAISSAMEEEGHGSLSGSAATTATTIQAAKATTGSYRVDRGESATAYAAAGGAAPPPAAHNAAPLRPCGLLYDPPFPQLPPRLQAEMDALLDYLGLAAEVYGSLPHVRCTDLPSLMLRHSVTLLFNYRSKPDVLLLDGRQLQLTARGYSQASALLAAVQPRPSEAVVAALPSPLPKRIWKVRLNLRRMEPLCVAAGRGVSSSGGSGVRTAAADCRPDTSLGVLLVHVEDERGGGQHRPRFPCSSIAGSTAAAAAVPVISLAEAATWAGPLPLLAAAMPSAAPGKGAAAAASGGGSGRSSLYLPGFFGWHIAGLAKGYNDGELKTRQLELYHRRLGQSYSIRLPPGPPAGVREVLYAHVCMYDRGEGLEVLDLDLGDLEVMGCI